MADCVDSSFPEARTSSRPSFSASAGGGRYQVRAELGRGGIAAVYEAYDTAQNRRIALKRVRSTEDPNDYRRAVELFEREYHTLAQLTHPRIVAVYDYAVDDSGPFYTMELLDGGDLQKLVPVDWRRATAFARDVCSALSLLHSRRMVHRDVGARNIRCTSDGLAKLIDFGAMIPIGPSKHAVVGTPPYVAPEQLQAMSLDARTDLYALGATLYYALVGRHAFPARTFSDLLQRWQVPPARPSEIVPEIPAALDALVLDLLQIDAAARPANAAEVIERLSAIDGFHAGEHLLVAQAYLSTPVLVGRKMQLERALAKARRALTGRGGAVLIEGASGVGRSRFLDACVLEAKLQGAAVLRADAGDGQAGDYGAVRALARAAVSALPAQAAALGPAPIDLRSGPSAALCEWFGDLSRSKPLLIAVDDLHRIDEQSLAWLAVFSRDLNRRRVALLAAVEPGVPAASAAALKLFSEGASKLELENLSLQETEKLLASVFGDVPNLGLVNSRIFDVSAGNPRDTLRLAQHLLDRGLVRYAAGAWSLPGRLESVDLPSSIAQALRSRVEQLDDDALELAHAVSLCAGLPLTFEECLLLTRHAQSGPLTRSLDALIRAEVLRSVGERFELAQQAWAPILEQGLDDRRARAIHLRLARMFERREGQAFRVGHHLIRGGDLTRGIEVLVRQAEIFEHHSARAAEDLLNFIRSLTPDWFDTYDRAIRLCDQLGRPKKEQILLRSRVAAVVSVEGTTDRVHLPVLISQLCDDSGLSDWHALKIEDPKTRLMTALGKARERYAARPEQERVFDPPSAIRQLARVLIQTSAVVTSSFDIEEARKLPSLAPLAPLSPSLGVIDLMLKGIVARTTGHFEHAQEAYAKVLSRTAEPDRAGLDESHHIHMRLGLMSGLGMIDAGMGLESSLEWARELEKEPLYRVNAVNVRMLYHLWQGDVRQAAKHKHELELLRIQKSARQFLEGLQLLWEITAHAAMADLTRTKHTLEEIDVLAACYPGWLPVQRYGRGEYHRLRGDLNQALAEFEPALKVLQAGEHQFWPHLAAAHLHTLLDLGRYQEAFEIGREYLDAAERADLGFLVHYVLLPFSLLEARIGEHAAAAATAERVIANLDAIGTTGLNLGLAYETRARIATFSRDSESFERYAGLFRGTFRGTSNPALAAKSEKLAREAHGIATAVASQLADDLIADESRALSMLDTCHGTTERGRCALSWLVQGSCITEGYLFLLTPDGPSCVAQLGEQLAPPAIRALAEAYLATELNDENTVMVDSSRPPADESQQWSEISESEGYRPVLLSHTVQGGVAVTGVAVFVVPSGSQFSPSARLASEFSKRVEQLGDVTGMIIAS